MKRLLFGLSGFGLLLHSPGACAHSFGRLYNLPVPFWMYVYAAAAALVVSFAIVGYFVNAKTAGRNEGTRLLGHVRAFRLLTGPLIVRLLRLLSVFALLLTIGSGLFGSRDSYTNISMTLFWIVFVLGFTYLTALIGNVYAAINPWKVLVDWTERWVPGSFAGRYAYPAIASYYPALAFYIAFIWIELFGNTTPLSLSVILLAYTACNFLGAWLFGKRDWFKYCEFFGVFLGLIARIAPFSYVTENGRGPELQLRHPFMGLLQGRAEHLSLLIFALFTLASTAYDGAHVTLPWVSIYWKGIYPLLTPDTGVNMIKSYPFFVKLYYVYESLCVVLAPFLYLGVYWLFVWLAKIATRTSMSVSELALEFGFTLIPIAFVYNVSHYYTLLVSQGASIIRLISDPLGLGWNLFGTAGWQSVAEPTILDINVVWHTQVWLILFGHIVSVYLAHLKALKLFPSHNQAALSQLPMLLLMVAFTTIGLWILAQPITAGQIWVPA
jgi:hypothetical protein